ncbi:MAG TPA: right-handed parallel beta-helix repeat-containing protein, partial [Kofleriaceae bacterium]|nr:right-handed parallel beta-helix repeat-containing protein [Kofleriaceae bacterium]
MRRLLILAGLVAAGATAAHADTIKLGGNVINETWTPAGSPYILQGDITVPVGSTLTIMPGTTVRAVNGDSQAAGLDAARVELTVKGTLDVEGTAAMPVTFNGMVAGAGTWYGLVIDPLAAAATMNNVAIDGATYGLTYQSAGNVLATTGVSITSAKTNGVRITAGAPTLDGISIATSGTFSSDAGFYVGGSASPTLNGCVVRNQNGYGVMFDDTTAGKTLSLVNCTIHASTSYGVLTDAAAGTVNLVSTIVSSSGNVGVYRNDASAVTATYSDLWNNAGGNASPAAI